MKSKTLIEKQLKKKTNSELVETILTAKKNKAWMKTAEILAGPRKNRMNFNLEELDKIVQEGEHVLIIGKVLSQGELNKKIKITALSFSEKAKEKLLKTDSDISTILEEIKKNPEAKGIKILE
jgi:large subunit ribosomal protein L18e